MRLQTTEYDNAVAAVAVKSYVVTSMTAGV